MTGRVFGFVFLVLGLLLGLDAQAYILRGQLQASADGKNLFYLRRDGPRQQIARLGLKGGEEELVTPPNLFATEPRPHPGGKGIAFIGRTNEGERLFYLAPGATKATALTPAGKYRNPQWNPQGDHLMVCQLFGRQWDYLYLDTTGKKRLRLLNYTKGASAKTLAKRIYVECGTAFDTKGKSVMVTVDADLWTIKLQNLKPENVMGTEILDYLPVTMPRNKGFGFVANERGFTSELYTIKKDGSGLKRYSNSLTGEAPPAFDPLGKFMAYGAWINNRRVLVETDLNTRESKRMGTGMFPQFEPVYAGEGRYLYFLEQRGTPEITLRRIDRQTSLEEDVPLSGVKPFVGPLPVEELAFPPPPPETNPWIQTTAQQNLPDVLKPKPATPLPTYTGAPLPPIR